MKPDLTKRKKLELQAHGQLLLEFGAFADFWEGPYVTPKGDVCSICGGKYPFPDQYAWGIKPDREHRPELFICWECCHWLLKTLVEQIVGESYKQVFDTYPPFKHVLGKPAGTTIINQEERKP